MPCVAEVVNRSLKADCTDFYLYDNNNRQPATSDSQAMFTLYRIGFCSASKVAPVQCEQELMFCCGAEIVSKRSQCEQKPYPLCNLQRSLLI